MLSCEKLQEMQNMQNINIHMVNPDDIVDITEVEIDMKKSVSGRVKSYVETVHNPFLVKVGDYTVKIGYSDCKETLNDRMKQYISKMAEINY